MNEADRNLLVEIRLCFPKGGFEVSTGYPVQRDLILTARHGLFPEDCPPDAKIKLRWFHQRGDSGKPIEVQRSAIIWESQVLDAALIGCQFPEGLRDCRHLSPLRPFHGESWASEGFPLGADSKEGETVAFPLGGMLHGAATTAQCFHLELPPNFKTPQDWGGVSGAPVFVRGQIAGIIVSTPSKAEGRLKALFSAELFKDPEFAERIGYDRDAGRVAALKAAAKSCLDESEYARTALGNVLGIAETQSDKLVTKLMELPSAEAVIKAIKDAHKRAAGDKEANAAATLRQLILIALPARYDAGIVDYIRISMADPHRPVLAPTLCTGTAAELAMAAAEGQPARFKGTVATEANPYPLPESPYSIDHPPVSGMEQTVNDDYFKDAWIQHLINKYASNLKKFDKNEIIKVVARRLQISDDQKRTHYVLLEDTGDDDDNAAWDRRAGLIRDSDCCPSLVFLRLDRHGDIVSETALLDPFCKLLAESRESHQ